MGACDFYSLSKGKTAQEAFDNAFDNAAYEHGHGGYTGTIAEKSEFTMIDLPAGMDAQEYAELLMLKDDRRVADKWGPAGCIQIAEGEFLFFGYAAS